MVGVTRRRAAQRVPDIGEVAVFNALKSDIAHAVVPCKLHAA
jgi:hypothetical protein